MSEKKRTSKWDYSEAAAEYRKNYLKDNYVRLQAFVMPEEKEEVVKLAKAEGISITQYIRNALKHYKTK